MSQLAIAPPVHGSSPLAATAPRGSRVVGHLQALTGLRFFAALWVVFHHFNGFVHYPVLLQKLFGDGPSGVTLFFVLSGFVLTYNYLEWFERDLGRYLRFLQARFARIYPIYLVGLVLGTVVTGSLLYSSVIGGHHDGPTLSISWLANLVLVQAYIPVRVFHEWNDPAWSISTEFAFYLAFPFFIRYILARCDRLSALARLAVCLYVVQMVVFLALSASLKVAYGGGQFDYLMIYLVRHSPVVSASQFFLGCVIGLWYLRYRSGQRRNPFTSLFAGSVTRNLLLLTALASVAIVPAATRLVLGSGQFAQELRFSVLFTPIAAVIIGVLVSGPTLISPILENSFVVLLGEASYALYIIHWIPTKLLMQRVAPAHAISPALSLVCIAALVATSIGLFKLIEVPARRWLRSWAWRPAVRTAPA